MDNKPFKVLVVDDEVAVRELTIRALVRDGFDCSAAIDGEQALKLVEHESYDAVVTDLRMPNLHGHALSVELLKLENRPLVVVLTGVLEPKLAKDLLKRGIDDIFFKPVDHRLLSVKLSSLLTQRAADNTPAEV